MLISAEMIGTSIVSIIATLFIGYFGFRVKLESRLKDLEKEIQILEPMKSILIAKGSEHVSKIFKEGN